MAGHCQLHVLNGTILIYGGLTTLNLNVSAEHNGYPILEFSNLAWILDDKKDMWTNVKTNSPCDSSRLPPTMMQQCVKKGPSEVVILHQNFEDFSTCTSLLNVATFEWVKIASSQMGKLPLGGFMLSGVQPFTTFYLGGYNYDLSTSNNTVYELTNKWELTNTQLAFGMTGWDSMVMESRLNLTKCKMDKEIWPYH